MRIIWRISTRNIILFLFVLMCTFLLTSCTKNIGHGNVSNHTINIQKSTTQSLKETRNVIETEQENSQEISLDKLKSVVKEVINDDIWYNGKNSAFKDFESQKTKIEIYSNPYAPNLISVYFDRLFKAGGYNEGTEQYFAIEIGKGERGYNSELAGFVEDVTSVKVREHLKEQGYILYETDEITFDKVTQPKFSSVSDAKKRVINDIENKVIDRLKEWGKTGKFIVNIRNFNDNSYSTYVVIQDDKGKVWVLEIALEKNWFVGTGKFLEVGVDVDQFTAEQYKKVSFEKEVIL